MREMDILREHAQWRGEHCTLCALFYLRMDLEQALKLAERMAWMDKQSLYLQSSPLRSPAGTSEPPSPRCPAEDLLETENRKMFFYWSANAFPKSQQSMR